MPNRSPQSREYCFESRGIVSLRWCCDLRFFCLVWGSVDVEDVLRGVTLRETLTLVTGHFASDSQPGIGRSRLVSPNSALRGQPL